MLIFLFFFYNSTKNPWNSSILEEKKWKKKEKRWKDLKKISNHTNWATFIYIVLNNIIKIIAYWGIIRQGNLNLKLASMQ